MCEIRKFVMAMLHWKQGSYVIKHHIKLKEIEQCTFTVVNA